MEPLPPTLKRALSDKHLAILCGAGVSMQPPSYLPSWWQFNEILLEEIKLSASRLLPEGLAPLFRSIQLSENSIVGFSDRLETQFAGEGYFSVLDVMNSSQPNENHRAMAELARVGVLKVILSTNFDTLIELAFENASVELDVAVGESGLENLTGSRCALIKLHGSVGKHSTLIDTIRQKLCGLSATLQLKLREIAATHHVLAVGISGADFQFRKDYFPLSPSTDPRSCLTWVALDPAKVNDEVRTVVAQYRDRGSIVQGRLPELFGTLGCDVSSRGSVVDTAIRSEVTRRAREHVCRWIEQPFIGPLSCVAFCIDYLLSQGAEQDAFQLANSIEYYCRDSSKLKDPTIVPVFRVIGMVAAHKGDLEKAEYWWGLAQLFAEEYAESMATPFRKVTWCESRMNVATTLVNRAALARRKGDSASAVMRCQSALSWAKSAGHTKLIGRDYIDRAILAREDGDSERAIRLTRTARKYGEMAGCALTISEAYVLEADLLFKLFEYDRALTRIEQARRTEAVMSDIQVRVQLELLSSYLSVSRASEDDASRRLHVLMSELADCGMTQLLDQVRFAILRCLCHSREHREAAVRAAQAAAGGQQVRESRGWVGVVPDSSVLLGSARAVASGFCDGLPIWLRDGRSDDVRLHIGHAEYAGDHTTVARHFRALLDDAAEKLPPDRQADLAEGLLSAARKADLPEEIAHALLAMKQLKSRKPKNLADEMTPLLSASLSKQVELRLLAAIACLRLGFDQAVAEQHFREAIRVYQEVRGCADIETIDADLAWFLLGTGAVVHPALSPDEPSLVVRIAIRACNVYPERFPNDRVDADNPIDERLVRELLGLAKTATDHEFVAMVAGPKRASLGIGPLRHAEQLHRDAGRKARAVECAFRLSDLLLWAKDRDAAIRQLDALISVCGPGYHEWRARALWKLAAIRHEDHDWAEAANVARSCLDLYDETPFTIWTAKAAWMWSHTQCVLENWNECIRSVFWVRELLGQFSDGESKSMLRTVEDLIHGMESSRGKKEESADCF